MDTITRKCQNCKHEFEAPGKDVRRGRAKFCSVSCARRSRPRVVHEDNAKCAWCDRGFFISNSRRKLSKSGLYFCCRSHKDEAQSIGGLEAISPPHYGTCRTSYRKFALKRLPGKCNRCGHDDDRILVVHHVDRNRENNVIENLEILCPNCHLLDHYLGKDGTYNWRK